MSEKSSKVQLLADIVAQVKKKELQPLLNRDFVTIETGTGSEEVIRVMQWNMLAQGKCKILANYCTLIA